MQYQVLPDDPHAVLWMSEHGSGIAREGDPQWDEYQQFLTKGGELVQLTAEPITLLVALEMVNREVDRVGAAIGAGYTQQERDSWPTQAIEATAWLANPDTPTPLINALQLPYEDKTALCQNIVAHYQAYTEQTGELIMWRRIAAAAIEAYFASGRPITALTVHYPEVPYAS